MQHAPNKGKTKQAGGFLVLTAFANAPATENFFVSAGISSDELTVVYNIK
jgi:hypothetical protein